MKRRRASPAVGRATAGSSFRLDLHVHSRHSFDATGTVLELAMAAQQRGLHGFALTDHDTHAGHKEIKEASRRTGMLIIPGVEVSTQRGHLLALGVSGSLPKGRSLLDTIDAIDAQSGIAVPAHPLRMGSGIGPGKVADLATLGRIPACECSNARDRRMVWQACGRLADRLQLAQTGGTDAHWVQDIGQAWTEFPQRHDDVDSALEAIRKGACKGAGEPLGRWRVYGHGLTVPWRKIQR